MLSSHPTLYCITMQLHRRLMCFLGIFPIDWPRWHPFASPMSSSQERSSRTTKRVAWNMFQACGILTLLSFVVFQRLFNLRKSIYSVEDGLSSAMDLLGYIVLTTVHAIVQVESFWKWHKHQRIFMKCEAFRGELLKHFSLRFDSTQLQLYVFLLHALQMVYCATQLIFFMLFLLEDIVSSRIVRLTLHSELVLRAKWFEFMLIAVTVMLLQEELLAAAMLVRRQLEVTRFAAWPERRNCLACIFTLKDLHAMLWEMVQDIAYYFEWSLPGLLLKQLIDLTLWGYWSFLCFEIDIADSVKIYCVIIWTIKAVTMAAGFFICAQCEQLHNIFGRIFHDITADRRNLYVASCVRSLEMQLLHERINLVAGGCVTMNTATLGQFFLTVVLYLVIVIQFRMSIYNGYEEVILN